MEFIGAMYLQQAGLCTQEEETQLRIQHLEATIASYLPVIIMGDAFQHWVYDNSEQAMEPEKCRQKWAELSRRYQPDIDWSGLQSELQIGCMIIYMSWSDMRDRDEICYDLAYNAVNG